MNAEESKKKDLLVKTVGYCSIFKRVVGRDPGSSGDLHMYYGALMFDESQRTVTNVDKSFYHQRVSGLFGDLTNLVTFLQGYNSCISDMVDGWKYNTECLFSDEIER